MKKIVVLVVLAAALCGAGVDAQRPVGDTINIGEGDYLYYPLYANGAYAQCNGTIAQPEPYYRSYWTWYLKVPLMGGQMSFEEFIQENPDMACDFAGRRIVGQEFPQTTESVMVIGLAVCPTICTDVTTIPALPSLAPYLHVVDTAVANRETEYVQLYTISGNQPEFRAEGAWRIEDPHRYMMFPSYVRALGSTVIIPINDTQYVPLYEAMFDTGVLIEGKPYMVAGTHNNNSTMWSTTAIDMVFDEPHICWQHYPITYSTTYCGYNGTWWCCRDTTWPWVSYSIGGTGRATNIFPILDTLFGTPCASVTGLQTVATDSLSATLMWSADARQHDWRVWYRPTDDTLGSGSVVTVAVPTVTLSGLTPGTEYSVAVRGRCDINNYSPWSDTLLFTTPRDTTQVIDTTNVDTTTTQGISRVGNLDLYTRIMPNPAGEVVNVLSSYRLESVAVYDLAGRLIMVQDAEGISAMVNVSALAQGTYIMAIHTLQGVATKRLVVRRN